MEQKFNASRLVAARLRVRLTKKELAARVGVAQKSVANYEDGVAPNAVTAQKLSEVLGFPIAFFYGEDIECPRQESASFRSFSRMTAAQCGAALSAGGLAFAFDSWIDARFHLPEVDVPDLAGTDPETAAAMVRVRWNLGVLPIKNMIHLLESRGVRVFSLVEDTREVNAFSSWRSGTIPFVFLNTVKSSESSRFDAAHELGHLVLHRHGDPKGKQTESEANTFASALLMPKSEMRAISGCRSVSDVMRIKKRWNVSAMALVYRLHKVGVLTEWLYRAMCIELSSKGMRTDEQDSAERESSLRLKKVFDGLKAQGKSLREVAAELSLPVEELHKLVFGLTPVSLVVGTISRVVSAPVRGHLRLVK